jgi:hypothetical protein
VVLEFAYNLNPNTPATPTLTPGTGTAGLPSIHLPGTGADRHLVIEYVRRKAGGVIYTPQFGNTPAGASRQSATAPPVVTSIDATWERVMVEDTVAVGGTTRRFGSVLVTKP